jgi:hypothetical protein
VGERERIMPHGVTLADVVIAGIFVIVLILALVRDVAARWTKGVAGPRKWLLERPEKIWYAIADVWGLKGEKKKQEGRIPGLVDEEVNFRIGELRRHGRRFDEEKIIEQSKKKIGEAEDPTAGEIVGHWGLRFFYIILVLVCVISDFVLVATRVGLLFGGQVPPFLRNLFPYLQPITAVLFVSVAALAGLLIEEYTIGASNYVKLSPDMRPRQKHIYLGLAIAMAALDVIAIVALAITGAILQFSSVLLSTPLLVVTLATPVLVFIGILLAFGGLIEGFEALVTLIGGIVFAVIALVFGVILALVELLLRGLAALSARIHGKRDIIPLPDQGGLAIIGYGPNGGSKFAVGLCQQIKNLYDGDRRLWLAGAFSTLANDTSADALESTGITDRVPRIPNNEPHPAQRLVRTVSGFLRQSRQQVKPLVWISADRDIDECLTELKKLGSEPDKIDGIKLVLQRQLLKK